MKLKLNFYFIKFVLKRTMGVLEYVVFGMCIVDWNMYSVQFAYIENNEKRVKE